MAVSAKSRLRHVLIDEPVADAGTNDNNPGMHPGHELSDLHNCPRQPAAEAVIHYARFAHIESFPLDPRSASNGHVAAPSMDASVEKGTPAASKRRKWIVAAACISSLIFHLALVTALMIGFVVTPDDPVEEAGESVSVIILGDSDVDQSSTGEKVEDPQPEDVVAESVQPETVQPTETVPEDVQATEPQEVAPTQAVTRVSPENATAVEPEILTSLAPAETSVVQPMATQVPENVPPETPPVTQATPAEVTPVQPTEVVEVAPEPDVTPTPTPKPKAETPVEKPKPDKKVPPKKVVPAAGNNGQNKQDATRGSADGDAAAQSDRNSRSAGSSGGAGSAAVANYPGKVQSRIRRAIRVPAQYKRMAASMSVSVRLSIGASGALSGISVARSSGIPELDQAAVDGVRRAAPFPPLPSEWGKPVWTFTQELQVTGR